MTLLLVLALLNSNPTPDADSQGIKTLVAAFREGVQKGDAAAVSATFWPDAVVFEHGGVDRSAKAFVDEHLAAHFKTMKLKWVDEENLGRSEGAMAYVAQRAVLETTEKGATKKAPHTFTFVFRKRDGAWKIAHLHWSIGKSESVGSSAPDGGR